MSHNYILLILFSTLTLIINPLYAQSNLEKYFMAQNEWLSDLPNKDKKAARDIIFKTLTIEEKNKIIQKLITKTEEDLVLYHWASDAQIADYLVSHNNGVYSQESYDYLKNKDHSRGGGFYLAQEPHQSINYGFSLIEVFFPAGTPYLSDERLYFAGFNISDKNDPDWVFKSNGPYQMDALVRIVGTENYYVAKNKPGSFILRKPTAETFRGRDLKKDVEKINKIAGSSASKITLYVKLFKQKLLELENGLVSNAPQSSSSSSSCQ